MGETAKSQSKEVKKKELFGLWWFCHVLPTLSVFGSRQTCLGICVFATFGNYVELLLQYLSPVTNHDLVAGRQEERPSIQGGGRNIGQFSTSSPSYSLQADKPAEKAEKKDDKPLSEALL